MNLTISRLASAASVNVQTVRYYERRGLLPAPERTRSGYRQYDPEAVRRLRFIKRAQQLGFTLEEIRALLALRVRQPTDGSCSRIEAQTRRKIRLVEQKMEELERILAVLQRLANSCRDRRATAECPILEALESEVSGGNHA